MSGKKRRESAPIPPPAKKLKLTVTPELAAEQYGFKLIRSLDRKFLQSETVASLNSHNYDPLQKDSRAKEIIRSGSLSSKCELVKSDERANSPFKVVAKHHILKNECVAVYMGSLIEERRCSGSNIWQYNIPNTLFPKKNKIPSLVLDGSKTANETRFFHAAEWYNKSPNITHFIVWDNESRLPQVIYRATCNIDAGQDLLLKWGLPDNSAPPVTPSNNINRDDEAEKLRRHAEQITRHKQAQEEAKRLRELLAEKLLARVRRGQEDAERNEMATEKMKQREVDIKQREEIGNKQQHATAKISKKQPDASAVLNRKLKEEDDEVKERQIEVEIIQRPTKIASIENNNSYERAEENTSAFQSQPKQAPTKPVTEINFFLHYEATINIGQDSPLISNFSENERTFDLNTLALSDEEQIDANFTANYVDNNNNNNTFVL